MLERVWAKAGDWSGGVLVAVLVADWRQKGG